MRFKKIMSICTLVALGVAGCSGGVTTPNISFTTQEDKETTFRKDYSLTQLVHSPKVFIAKRKETHPSYEVNDNYEVKGQTKIIGGTDRGHKDYESRELRTLSGNKRSIGKSYDQNSGLFASLNQYFNSSDYSTSLRNRELDPSTLPVVSTVYGGPVTVIKAINGGFGMILFNRGVAANGYACEALFGALPVMQVADISHFAEDYGAYFRPTYWLDRRNSEHDKPLARAIELASYRMTDNPYLMFASSEKQSDDDQTDFQDKHMSNCDKRLKYYNYSVSNALLKRLQLVNQRGPFLVAWREDGTKAMVLDMSHFTQKADFEDAMETWIKNIVRHPTLWKEDVLQQASFRQKLRSLLNKGGESLLALLSPVKTVSYSKK